MREGSVHSQKLVTRAISRLHSLPGGDIGLLCNTVAEQVHKLTEIRKWDLEPYLGLHYPATDIPQAARFLFRQNRVGIIVDCRADFIKLIRSEKLKRPICLVNSTLRAPHSCHAKYMANMGTIASLVMAIVINTNESTKLWGLVVCHHCTPRYVPFPLRYACEFYMQAVNLQLKLEFQLAQNKIEKNLLRMQTNLCDMLLRDDPSKIVTQSPTIMDLIKCDGAALYYNQKVWLLGVTPNESQVIDIANWLLREFSDKSMGFATESLSRAGYPGAPLLGDAVCGMVAARFTAKDFLFWFRSHSAREIKWGGANNHPDDDAKMNPRSSFHAFLEVTKSKSLPWDVWQINAVHSLQLMMTESVRGCGSDGQKSESRVQEKDELKWVLYEMVRLIETASVPIFGVDLSGLINGWNEKVAELTGLRPSEAKGKLLIDQVVHDTSHGVVESLIYNAMQGKEEKNVELKLKNVDTNNIIHIVANTCTSRDYMKNVVGVCFVGQDVTPEKTGIDKFDRIEGDYKAIMQSKNPLMPPLFASDENACCFEWNPAMEKLSGYERHEVIGKVLNGEVFGGLCQLQNQDFLTKFSIILSKSINGDDSSDLPFGFFNRVGHLVEVRLTTNEIVTNGGKLVGCFCFVENNILQRDNRDFVLKLGELDYMKQEIKNTLNGLRFSHKLLENTTISDNQKQYLEVSSACERQIMSIIENMDLKSMEDGNIELKMEEFVMENILDTIVSQVMIVVTEKKIQLIHEIPERIKTLVLYGDRIKLQMVLSDLLLSIVNHTPFPNGWVEIKVSQGLRLIQDGHQFIHLQFRMSHPGPGLPEYIIKDMYEETKHWSTREGLVLNLSTKLLSIMNGHVHYIRDDDKCYFLLEIKLKMTN